MDFTLVLFGLLGLLCVHQAWIIFKLNRSDQRTSQADHSLRAQDSVADRIAAASRSPSSQQFAQDDQDHFVRLIQHLEGGRKNDDARHENYSRPAAETSRRVPSFPQGVRTGR